MNDHQILQYRNLLALRSYLGKEQLLCKTKRFLVVKEILAEIMIFHELTNSYFTWRTFYGCTELYSPYGGFEMFPNDTSAQEKRERIVSWLEKNIDVIERLIKTYESDGKQNKPKE